MCLVAAAFLLILGRPTAAQDDGPFKQKITVIKKKKLIEALNLSPEKEAAFLKIYDEYADQRKKLRDDRKALLKKLVHMSALEGDVPGDRIRKTIDDLTNVDRQLIEERQKVIAKLSETLNDAQVAKFVLFEQSFPLKLREMMFDIQTKKFRDKGMPITMPPPEDELLD